MDMSPFANNNPQATPDYLKQTKTGSMTGAVSNMVKALMDGNNKFQARQNSMGGTTPNVGSAASYEAPGQPMSLAPPGAAPGPLSGGPPAPPPQSPFEQGTSPMSFNPTGGLMQTGMGAGAAGLPGMPNALDPTIKSLFSPIPGGQFG